jgi:hypothetical protein
MSAFGHAESFDNNGEHSEGKSPPDYGPNRCQSESAKLIEIRLVQKLVAWINMTFYPNGIFTIGILSWPIHFAYRLYSAVDCPDR